MVVIVQLIRKSLMVKGGKKWFYDKGTFKTISDVLAFKVAGTSAYVVKNAAYFELRVESASGFFYSNIPVDLTPIQKIKFSARNVNGNMYVGVQPNNSNVTGQRSVTVTSTSFAEYVIDVSDLTGNYYLVGGYTGGNTTKQVHVEQMWGE